MRLALTVAPHLEMNWGNCNLPRVRNANWRRWYSLQAWFLILQYSSSIWKICETLINYSGSIFISKMNEYGGIWIKEFRGGIILLGCFVWVSKDKHLTHKLLYSWFNVLVCSALCHLNDLSLIAYGKLEQIYKIIGFIFTKKVKPY